MTAANPEARVATTRPPFGIMDFVLGAACLSVLTGCALFLWRPWSASPQAEVTEEAGVITYRFGDVAPGEVVRRTVPVRNRTARPITIGTIFKSCTCLKSTVPSPVIPAGGEVAIEVSMEAPTQRGDFQYELIVPFDSDDVPPLTIRLLGSIGRWLEADPPTLAFGRTPSGTTTVKRLEVATDEPWPESEQMITCTLSNATARIVDRLADRHRVVCEVTFAPPLETTPAAVAGEVRVEWIGRPGRLFSVPCQARVVSAWEPTPDLVFVGRVRQDTERSFEIFVSVPAGVNVDACKVSVLPAGGARVSFARVPGESNRAIIRGAVLPRPATKQGVVHGEVHIDPPGGLSRVRIPVLWEWE